MTRRDRETEAAPRILVADDSPDAIVQMTVWIRERWPSAEVWSATAPEEAVRIAAEERIENFVLDLDFGAQRDSGAAVAKKILDARSTGERIPTRILFRTVHAGDPGYLHQVQKLMISDDRAPAVWGFLDKGSVPKRLVQNTVEQVFVYEVSFTDMFAQQLKNSRSRELSDLEFTVLIYLCLGVTNDGVGWLLATSRQDTGDPIPTRGPAGRSNPGREPDAPLLRGDDAGAGEPPSAPRGGCGASSARADSGAEARPTVHQPRLARRRPLARRETASPTCKSCRTDRQSFLSASLRSREDRSVIERYEDPRLAWTMLGSCEEGGRVTWNSDVAAATRSSIRSTSSAASNAGRPAVRRAPARSRK
jgi:CheY-like chemotaxis protein